MNIVLWVAQWMCALAFIMAGAVKVVRSKAGLEPVMGWVHDVPQYQIRLLGACELAGALGCVLPGLFHVGQFLTPAAAAGGAAVMVGAGVVHLRRHEERELVMPVILGLLFCLILVGRVLYPLS